MLLACAAPALAPPGVGAHARSVSYSSWHLDGDGGARVGVRISLLELSRLGIPLPIRPGLGRQAETEAVGRYLAEHLHLERGGRRCTPVGPPEPRPTDPGYVLYRWSVDCPGTGDYEIESRILLDRAPSHLHFARLTVPGTDRPTETGAAVQPARILERVLSESDPSWRIPGGPAAAVDDAALGATALGDYLALGVEHILTGWDHLAFVLALVLLARSLGEVARLVTGFTIAHSITLALAVLGWVEPRTASVEAVIGFSVALIAAENGWLLAGRGRGLPIAITAALVGAAALAAGGLGGLPALTLLGLAVFTACHFGMLDRARDPGALRIAIAFAFGLVHGFGFAGVLAEMALPTERLAPALLGFNLGVEVGQLAVVAVIWPVLLWLRRARDGGPHRIFAEVSTAAVCGLGVYWFVSRTFGPGAA